jgi:hypothetical protein
MYGDSYLEVRLADVEQEWRDSGLPALMTVTHNSGRWDTSNASFHRGRVFYDKPRGLAAVTGLDWIDYGLSAMAADVIARWLPPSGRGDLADLFAC